MVRSMMAQANLPISFWGDTLLTTAYILNCVPSQSVSFIPYELWKGEKPNLEHLCPWRSAGFVHSTTHKYGKLGPTARKHIFIRYSDSSKGYVIYSEHPNERMTEIELHDIYFIETDFSSIGDANRDLDLYELEKDEGTLPSSSEGGGLVPCPVIAEDSGSGLQPNGSITLDQDSQVHQVSKRGHIPHCHFEIEGNVLLCNAKDVDKPTSFSEALHSSDRDEWMIDMQDEMSFMDKNNVWELVDHLLGCKTIGNKWVIKDTFSPVVRFASIRLILSIVAKQDLELFQMDAKTTFLNGELDEEIYMAQPTGFEVQGHERKLRLLETIQRNFLVYPKGRTSRRFLNVFICITPNPLTLQWKKGCTLSLNQCPKNDEEKNQMSKVPYASAIGSLMYAMLYKHPDICFAVGMVSCYQSNPGLAHWRAVKRILWYFRGTIDHALCYHGRDLRLTSYSDANWASDKDERKSTSGYPFILGGGAVSWYSKKQSCIALSTMESEYVACSVAIQEAVWLRRFLKCLGVTTHAENVVLL
uniref:Uncharacterized protein n=1 Tax=Fagus sylvatica TaxID=28930 RepID=A0A2N9G1R4_FAGSY